jgi:hypothetical protein
MPSQGNGGIGVGVNGSRNSGDHWRWILAALSRVGLTPSISCSD